MIKLTIEQIEEILEIRNGFESQLQEVEELSKLTYDKSFLKKVAELKKGIIENINEFNNSIVDGLKKYNYEVPEYLYIRL